MCVAIPLGRGSDGPRGTRFGRFLRERPWRFTALVPVVGSALLVIVWVFAGPVRDAALLLTLVAQGLAAAPLFAALVTRLPMATGTSPVGHLWFAGLSLVFLVGVSGLALGLVWGPGWRTAGLLGLGWAWWLAARMLHWHQGWSRVRLLWPVRLLPVVAYLGAAGLGLAAVTVVLGQKGGLAVVALFGAALTLLLGGAVGLGYALAGRFGARAESEVATGHA